MVTWNTPQSDVAISRYQVQYGRSGTTVWSSTIQVPSSSTSYEIQHLVAGSEYQVRVRAISVIGNSNWSEVQSETTYRSELSIGLTGICNVMHALASSIQCHIHYIADLELDYRCMDNYLS